MIKLNVSAANIAVEEKETLTEGRVGLKCQFSFTGEWAGLAKTAVFEGAMYRDVILKDNTVTVPAECLACEGYSLSVGVYGRNAAGDIVIPTVYATVGRIQRSAYPAGKEAAEPTPDVVAQIQQAAANAEELARSVREDADLGKFSGPAGEPGGYYSPQVSQPSAKVLRFGFTPSMAGMPAVADTEITLPTGGSGGGESGADGGYYTPAATQPDANTLRVSFSPSETDMPAVDSVDITLPQGPKGDKGDTGATGATGPAGADGKSAYATAAEGGYTGTEAEFAEKLAAEYPTTLSVLQAVYPVGAIYLSPAAASPADLFGFGTWERIKDCFLLSAGDSYAAGTTGGAAQITQTVSQMPKHTHRVKYTGGNANGTYGGMPGTSVKADFAYNSLIIDYEGGGEPMDIMPPYLAVYVWQRTA